MNDCPLFGNLFGGCKFEGRYDEAPNPVAGQITSYKGPDDPRALLTLRVYIRDVCIRCGKIVERQK